MRRVSEQLRAIVGDYAPETGMLTVHQQKHKNKPKLRHVPLSPTGLWAYEQLAKGKKKGDLLCANTLGREMTDVTY